MKKRILTLALATLQAGQPLLAYAQSTAATYSVQVPVTTVPFTPSKTTYDFGSVLVGQRPQHLFTFINRGSEALTVTAVGGFMNASVISDDCTGKKLQGGESCTIQGALSVLQTTSSTGELRVSHTANSNPDVFALKATGVTASGMIAAVQPSVDFGDASLNQTVGPKPVSFKNIGSTPVEILDLNLSEGGANFTLDIGGCITRLAPGATCSMQATFKPQALGLLQGRIEGMLDDGSEVTLANLSGNGVQGTPTWSTTQLNFIDGQPNTKSANQSVTVTNTGRGVLNISSAAITGDSTFRLESHNCGATLLPGSSCTFQISNTPPDTSIHSGYLELQTTNSSLKAARIQVYSRPLLQKAILSVDPVTLDFGDVGVGGQKVMEVTLKATGNLPAGVSKYALSGPGAASFAIVNGPQCTGTLQPNNQCVLQLRAQPTAVGSQSGTVTLTTNTPDPVSPIQLRVNGLGPLVSADKVTLAFGPVDQGQTPTLTAILTNTGGAPAKLNSIAAPQGTTIFTNTRDTTGACVAGSSLAVGASCKLNVTFLTAGRTGVQTGSFVMNFDSGPILISTTGSVTPPPLPTATLSMFNCPATVGTGVVFSCTGTLTNTSVGNIALSGTYPFSLSNPAFGVGLTAPSSNCPTEAAGGLAPGQSCTVSINGKATSAITWKTDVTAAFKRIGAVGTGSATGTASTGAQAPKPIAVMTDFTCDNTTAQLGTSYLCTATLSSAGNVPLTIGAGAFTLNPTLRNTGAITSNCSASLAPGGSCTVTLKGSLSMVGVKSTTVGVSTNAAPITKAVNFTGIAAAVKLVTTNHPVLQYGEISQATHTVTNQGNWPVALKAPSITAVPGLTIASTTCGLSLQSGESCTITTTCNPSSTSRAGVLSVNPVVASSLPISGNVGCYGSPAKVVLESATGVYTTNAGGYSMSGNWYKFSNQGSGNVTLKSILIGSPASATTSGNFALYYDGAKPEHCAPNKVLVPNGSCLFLVTSSVSPGKRVTIPLQVNSTANPIAVNTDSGDVTGFSVIATKEFPATMLTGLSETAEYTITNQAKWPATNLVPQISAGTSEAGKGYSITSNNCPATLAAGASCKVTLAVQAPSTSGIVVAELKVDAAYPQILNGVAYPSMGSGPQGSTRVVVGTTLPKLTLTPMAYKPVAPGETSLAINVLKNEGTLPVTITGTPTTDSTYHTVLSTTCAGVLLPGKNCQITTQFKPTSNSTPLGAILSVPTNAMTVTGPLTGVMVTADLGIAMASATPTMPGKSGTFDATFSNVSTSKTVVSSGQFDFSATTVSGGANISITGMTCVSMTPGAACDATAKSVSIPSGGSVVVRTAFTAGSSLGTYSLKGTITGDASNARDTNLANNTAIVQGNRVDYTPTEKVCMFANPATKGRFLGCANNWCQNGSPTAAYLGISWLDAELFDGWVQVPGYQGGTAWYLPLNKAKWKGTGAPITPVSTKNWGGNVLPLIQYWNGSAWVYDNFNYYRGAAFPTVLAYWSGVGSTPGVTYHQDKSAPGTVMPVGNGNLGSWNFLPNGTEYLNYKASGVDYMGRQYRQVWVENSPGQDCMAPGTVKVQ